MIVYKPLKPIRAISFDLDDTLYANWPFIVAAEQHLREYIAERYKEAAHFSPKDWLGFKQQALHEDANLKHDMGALREITLTKAFNHSPMNKMRIPAAVRDCFDVFYHKRSDFKVADDICAVLSSLSTKVPLVAITNGNVNLSQIGIESYFNIVLHASKARRMKPFRDMFDEAARLLDLEASSILHVGDNLEKDVWGASRAGFQSAWYAIDRKMQLNNEHALCLPNIQLQHLAELTQVLA